MILKTLFFHLKDGILTTEQLERNKNAKVQSYNFSCHVIVIFVRYKNGLSLVKFLMNFLPFKAHTLKFYII
jgi:hypothetical protein